MQAGLSAEAGPAHPLSGALTSTLVWLKKKRGKKEKVAYFGCKQTELLIIGNHLDSLP